MSKRVVWLVKLSLFQNEWEMIDDEAEAVRLSCIYGDYAPREVVRATIDDAKTAKKARK